MTLLLLKTMSNKISLIALKRTIRASLNLIDPLTSDWTDTWGIGHKIPRPSPLKSSNLFSHHMLSFQMNNSITIRGWLRKSSVCESRRRVIVRELMKVVTTSNKLFWRGISWRGGLNRRRIWLILNEKKTADQKRAHPRKVEHQTSVLHDCYRTVWLEASLCSLEP
jgi:hypothetical protein